MSEALSFPDFLRGGWQHCQFEYFRDGVEICRLQLTFATGIPKEVCESINVGYRDPASIPALMADPNFHVIRDAGEVLFRLESERPAK